jgi:hypothetical protein
MSARRSLASAALGLGLGLLLGPLAGSAAAQVPSGNQPFFEPPDAQKIASELAQAQGRQGICYGWLIRVTGAGEDAFEVGSNAGPGTPVQQATGAACERWAEAEVSIAFTDESSELEDSAGVVISTSPSLNWQPDWNDLGISQADLLGDRSYAAVSNLIAGLPLLAAQDGVADSVEPAAAAATPAAPASDAPFGSPGPDLWRELGFALAFFGILTLSGIVWFVIELVRQRRRPQAAFGAPEPGTPPQPPSSGRRRKPRP